MAIFELFLNKLTDLLTFIFNMVVAAIKVDNMTKE